MNRKVITKDDLLSVLFVRATSSAGLHLSDSFLFKVGHLRLGEEEERSKFCVLPTTMRTTTALVAFSITLVMVELSDAVRPIKPTSFRTPVTRSQTKAGLRSSTFKKVVFGHRVKQYEFSNAPVYRQGYPLYRYYIAFRKDRAARISYEDEKLLDDEGNLCLGESAEMQMLEEGIDDDLVKFTYSLSIDNGWAMTWPTKIDKTISLQDENSEYFAVTTRARYYVPLAAGTNCTQIETTVKAALVEIQAKPKVTTKQTPNSESKPTTKPTKANNCNAGSLTD